MKFSLTSVLVIVGITVAVTYGVTGYGYKFCRAIGNSALECQQKAIQSNVDYVIQSTKDMLSPSK